jgi:hypothetical protein
MTRDYETAITCCHGASLVSGPFKSKIKGRFHVTH